MSRWLAVLVLLAACACTSWLLLTPRLPSVAGTPLQAQTLQAWLGDRGIATQRVDSVEVTSPAQLGCSVTVGPVERAGAQDSTTLHFSLHNQGDGSCLHWQSQVGAALQSRDQSPDGVRAGGPTKPRTPWETLVLGLAAALIGALSVMTLALIWQRNRTDKALFCLVFLTALVASALAPRAWTTVYFAYEWFAQAYYLDSLPRYGPGSTALWGMFLGPVTQDHSYLVAVQMATGCLLAGVAFLWFSKPTSGLVAGLLLALLPLFLRERASESMHLPAVTCLLVAAVAWRQGAVIASGLALALLALFRADLAPLAIPTWLLLVWIGPNPANNQGFLRAAWPALLIAGTGVAIALELAWHHAQQDLTQGNLPQFQMYLNNLPHHLWQDALLWRPDWLPATLWLAVLLSIAVPRADAQPRRWWLLAAMAVAWMFPGYADFNETSLPRLQMPAAVLLVLVAAGVIGPWLEGNMAWLKAFSAVLVLGSAAPMTTRACWAPANPQQEDQLLHQVLSSIAVSRPFWLVTRTYAEGPAEDLHLHLPTYLFAPWGRVISATDWLALRQRGAQPPQDVYFFESLRCWANPQREATSHQHPACTAVLAQSGWEPVWQRSLPNLRDTPTFSYYGQQPRLAVGLWHWHSK